MESTLPLSYEELSWSGARWGQFAWSGAGWEVERAKGGAGEGESLHELMDLATYPHM
jgi:hypothetical protein